ncbi:MAG TPA: TolC family protein, partial [Firmicutes bacterium]|nr:TolC family protein [Bacillota bacterium]
MSEVARYRVFFSAVIALVLLFPLASDAFAAMTLSDCLEKAFEQNPELLGAKEALAQARYGIGEAKAGFLPNLSLGGSYNVLEETQKVSFPDPSTGRMTEFKVDVTRDNTLQFKRAQPLYTGGRLTGSYRIARFAYDAAAANLERKRSEVALEVIRTFYGLLLARERVQVTRQALE